MITVKHEMLGVVFYSFYSHLVNDSQLVYVGDEVNALSVLGKEGKTGNSRGQHVHIGVYTSVNGKYNNRPYGYVTDWGDNPQKYLGADFVDYGSYRYYDFNEVHNTNGLAILGNLRNTGTK